jgi:hypothetical protein
MLAQVAEVATGSFVAATGMAGDPSEAFAPRLASAGGTDGKEVSLDLGFSAQPAVENAARPKATVRRGVKRFLFM